MEAAVCRRSPEHLSEIIAASAEGYAFPTNFDTDPAVGGMSPKTYIREALAKGMRAAEFTALIEVLDKRRGP